MPHDGGHEGISRWLSVVDRLVNLPVTPMTQNNAVFGDICHVRVVLVGDDVVRMQLVHAATRCTHSPKSFLDASTPGAALIAHFVQGGFCGVCRRTNATT